MQDTDDDIDLQSLSIIIFAFKNPQHDDETTDFSFNMYLSIENDDEASLKWSMASGQVGITFTRFSSSSDMLSLTSMRL